MSGCTSIVLKTLFYDGVFNIEVTHAIAFSLRLFLVDEAP